MRFVKFLLNEIIGTIHETRLRAIIPESFWRLVVCWRNDTIHVWILLFLSLLFYEILHEMFLRVNLVVDDLVTNTAFTRTVGFIIKFTHIFPLFFKEDFNSLFYVSIYTFL